MNLLSISICNKLQMTLFGHKVLRYSFVCNVIFNCCRLTNTDSFLQANLIILTPIPHFPIFLIYREVTYTHPPLSLSVCGMTETSPMKLRPSNKPHCFSCRCILFPCVPFSSTFLHFFLCRKTNK